ncbi:MAG: hypothetical protein ABMB14_07200 [Myxococcota bacterium]
MSPGSPSWRRPDRRIGAWAGAWAGAWVGACAVGLGCAPPALNDPPTPVAPHTPAITAFAVDCDLDAGSWSVAVEADGFTGGGVTFWTTDLVYLERHVVNVVASAPDGSRDELLLGLGIVSDWRDQTPNASTVFTCADAPTVSFGLLDADGAVVECRATGALAAEIGSLPGLGCPSD